MPASAPESVIQKRRRAAAVRAHNEKEKKAALAHHRALRMHAIEVGEKYRQEYAEAEKHQIEELRKARRSGAIFAPEQPKVALVIRIRGINGVPPRVKKTLRLLRLRSINSATFVRMNKATQNMLRLVEPYVAYGYPSASTVRRLVYKRGFAKINGQRVPLMSNATVASRLSDHGVSCMEELVHEVATCGPSFTKVNRFLYPFHLNAPRGGRRGLTRHFAEGGSCGDREQYIDAMVASML